MDQPDAIERVLLGESLKQISDSYRTELCEDLGLDSAAAAPTTFAKETRLFMNMLCRHLGERYEGDVRIASALCDWVKRVEDYDAWDALLSSFSFDGREALLRRGRTMFPGALTAHWDDLDGGNRGR